MKKAELIFISSPGLSHLISTVEAAKLLLDRDDRLSITLLIMKFPNDISDNNYTKNLSSNPNNSSRLQFINLRGLDHIPTSKNPFFDFIESHITHIREIVSNLTMKQPSVSNSQLAGLVLDMFCTKFIEVAGELGLPAYVFFTSGSNPLGIFQHFVSLKFEQNQDVEQYKNSDVELNVPCFSSPVPAKVLPSVLVDEDYMADSFLNCFRRISEMKGIMVNTFYELESYAIQSMQSDGNSPKVYPIGPVLNLSCGYENSQSFDDDVKKWLDDQPENSVVFLCFGTNGSFDEAQVKEIALALEKSGYRFLWSLRKQAMKGTMLAAEYENFEEVLPEGFMERTKGVGKVIGWAAQVAALSHPAVGGFVSHCGWNSILESVWFGVPIAAFPLFAEQQLNAFMLVKEMVMAEEIRIGYRRDFMGDGPPEIVGAEEIEAALRRLMEEERESGVRRKVKEMQDKAKSALMEGGSSYNAQRLFIEDVIRNVT